MIKSNIKIIQIIDEARLNEHALGGYYYLLKTVNIFPLYLYVYVNTWEPPTS